MIGSVQRTFNKFHLRKADRNRTYRHDEILELERMIIETIEKESKKMSRDTGLFPVHTHIGFTKKLIGGDPVYYECQFSHCIRRDRTVKAFDSKEEGIVYMCAVHRAINEGKTGHTVKKGNSK